MKLFYLFSKNKKIGSRLISWASGLLVKDLEKVPSHVALLISCDNLELVVESVLENGVRVIPYSVWKTINEECYKIEHDLNSDIDVASVISNVWGKKYDWLGVIFFALCFIGHLLFKIPFPKKNYWHSRNKYFCTEVVAKLNEYDKYSMTTPAKMCSDFLKDMSNEFRKF